MLVFLLFGSHGFLFCAECFSVAQISRPVRGFLLPLGPLKFLGRPAGFPAAIFFGPSAVADFLTANPH
jgi:hypothetical protein